MSPRSRKHLRHVFEETKADLIEDLEQRRRANSEKWEEYIWPLFFNARENEREVVQQRRESTSTMLQSKQVGVQHSATRSRTSMTSSPTNQSELTRKQAELLKWILSLVLYTPLRKLNKKNCNDPSCLGRQKTSKTGQNRESVNNLGINKSTNTKFKQLNVRTNSSNTNNTTDGLNLSDFQNTFIKLIDNDTKALLSAYNSYLNDVSKKVQSEMNHMHDGNSDTSTIIATRTPVTIGSGTKQLVDDAGKAKTTHSFTRAVYAASGHKTTSPPYSSLKLMTPPTPDRSPTKVNTVAGVVPTYQTLNVVKEVVSSTGGIYRETNPLFLQQTNGNTSTFRATVIYTGHFVPANNNKTGVAVAVNTSHTVALSQISHIRSHNRLNTLVPAVGSDKPHVPQTYTGSTAVEPSKPTTLSQTHTGGIVAGFQLSTHVPETNTNVDLLKRNNESYPNSSPSRVNGTSVVHYGDGSSAIRLGVDGMGVGSANGSPGEVQAIDTAKSHNKHTPHATLSDVVHRITASQSNDMSRFSQIGNISSSNANVNENVLTKSSSTNLTKTNENVTKSSNRNLTKINENVLSKSSSTNLTKINENVVTKSSKRNLTKINKNVLSKSSNRNLTKINKNILTKYSSTNLIKTNEKDLTKASNTNLSKINEIILAKPNNTNLTKINEIMLTKANNNNITIVNERNLTKASNTYITVETLVLPKVHGKGLSTSTETVIGSLATDKLPLVRTDTADFLSTTDSIGSLVYSQSNNTMPLVRSDKSSITPDTGEVLSVYGSVDTHAITNINDGRHSSNNSGSQQLRRHVVDVSDGSYSNKSGSEIRRHVIDVSDGSYSNKSGSELRRHVIDVSDGSYSNKSGSELRRHVIDVSDGSYSNKSGSELRRHVIDVSDGSYSNKSGSELRRHVIDVNNGSYSNKSGSELRRHGINVSYGSYSNKSGSELRRHGIDVNNGSYSNKSGSELRRHGIDVNNESYSNKSGSDLRRHGIDVNNGKYSNYPVSKELTLHDNTQITTKTNANAQSITRNTSTVNTSHVIDHLSTPVASTQIPTVVTHDVNMSDIQIPKIPPWIHKGPLIAKQVIQNTFRQVRGEQKLKWKLLAALVREMERHLVKLVGGSNPVLQLHQFLPWNLKEIIRRVDQPQTKSDSSTSGPQQQTSNH